MGRSKPKRETLARDGEGGGDRGDQWRKGSNNISGATTDTLTINNAVFADEGSYDVVVANANFNVLRP